VQHFAFRVADKATVERAKESLTGRGIPVVGPTIHDDFLYSIYFFDPSGHRLELTAVTATAEQDAQFRQEAMDVLRLWETTHDWSQRATLFGGAKGYRREGSA
jgi:catechol-2,3-dioxygenase